MLGILDNHLKITTLKYTPQHKEDKHQINLIYI